jgi:hypothetical protein
MRDLRYGLMGSSPRGGFPGQTIAPALQPGILVSFLGGAQAVGALTHHGHHGEGQHHQRDMPMPAVLRAVENLRDCLVSVSARNPRPRYDAVGEEMTGSFPFGKNWPMAGMRPRFLALSRKPPAAEYVQARWVWQPTGRAAHPAARGRRANAPWRWLRAPSIQDFRVSRPSVPDIQRNSRDSRFRGGVDPVAL